MPKNAQTTAQLHSSHIAGKVILKILLARLQQYLNHELPDVQAGFIKGRGTRDQIANICWINEKARDFKKKKKPTYSCFIDYAKVFDCVSHFSCVRLCATPYMSAHQAPRSLGFSRQEHGSGLPFPSPMHEGEK